VTEEPEEIARRTRRAYDGCARFYAGDGPRDDDPPMRETTRRLFRERLRGPRVLEVGCGPGNDSLAFRDAGLEVTATDFSEEFIRIVRERVPGVEARVMDMTKPDLPEASFDGVYGFGCFFHLPRSQAPPALTGLRRLLRPGGVLFLGLITSTKVTEYDIEDWGGSGIPARFTCWEREDFRGLLEAAGFTESEFLQVPSGVYDQLPRLVERGVRTYLACARAPGPREA
jgi:SAM-dependent methyltransferase